MILLLILYLLDSAVTLIKRKLCWRMVGGGAEASLSRRWGEKVNIPGGGGGRPEERDGGILHHTF